MRSLSLVAVTLAFTGCGAASSAGPGLEQRAGAADAGITVVPGAACRVTLQDPPLLASPHVPIGTDVQWNSNPPSSGPHYPVWAAFQEFESPVPRGYYVHDLEHGAIVLLYNCALLPDGGGGSDCAALVQGLREAAAQIPDDPLCASSGVRARVVITPDPLIDSPVAAAAWGHVYNAACIDPASLRAFAQQHYAHAPEDECANGVTSF